ncbi:MAG: DNA repair protein RadC [Chitinispirillales bacterium]|jgi:DNA repair protein RadC|nr:DNA repair protein RadC [Chitinispirillales bacterium]
MSKKTELIDGLQVSHFKPDHHGHRGRLLNRYIRGGIDSLQDYEILELLLTYVIPRKDTKPLAKTLLERYGTIGAVINAPLEELHSFKGLKERSASLFPFMRDAMSYCLNENFIEKPVVTHRKDVEKYLRFNFGYRSEEYVAVIFLDNANHVLNSEIMSEGTVNHCVVYPRNIINRALRCGAAAFILAHNHPSGKVDPSEEDWKVTERLFTVGKLLEVPLLDHVIISQKEIISLRELRRWPK